MKYKRIVSFILFGLLLIEAAAKQGVGVRLWITNPGRRAVVASRGYYELKMPPGGQEQHVLDVSNPADETSTIAVYPGDGFNALNGALTGQQLGESVSDAGRWLTLEHSQLKLEPAASQRVAFQVTAPANATPGEHLCFVFLQPEDATVEKAPKKLDQGETSVEFAVKERVGVLVIVTVEGNAPAPAFSIEAPGSEPADKSKKLGKAFQNGQIFYRVRLHNRGGFYLKPVYHRSLCDAAGKVVVSQDQDKEAGYLATGD